jgi:hypothetical protein
VVVVVKVLAWGILRYELQKVSAAGPIFLRTPRHPVNFEQSMARLSRYAAAVGSGQAATSWLAVTARKSLKATIALEMTWDMEDDAEM